MKYILFAALLSTVVFAEISPNSISLDNREATVIKSNNSFNFQTNENLRDNLSKSRKVNIDPNYPSVNSNSNMFDALFALAIDEMKENMVTTIYDSSFGRDRCDCFETGKKWNYVWTRDIAYSVNLSLASLDPIRAMNSLLFKVSNKRGQGSSSAQIVQDTGTGGSWPISTDRVTWALGARELIKYLSPSDKVKFSKVAYTALKNSIEADRKIVFDQEAGLYTGEQSFLDWREQTYPMWLKKNVVHIGMSKSLSTNIAHFIALETTVIIGKQIGKSNSKHSMWASQLKKQINSSFWDQRRRLYSLMLTSYLDQTKIDKFDLLGNSLAVLYGVAQTSGQKNLLKNYNMTSVGAPVIFPQDSEAPIYHNRAIWPFVTSYALLASKKQKQSQIFDHLFKSTIVGAALNLSNMENFEFTTLKNYFYDSDKSGPIVNSQRQLWSVAGFLSTYIDGIFGKQIKNDSINFSPFITSTLRNTLLKNSDFIELQNFKWKGKIINLRINLPPESILSITKYYSVSNITFNERKINPLRYQSFHELKSLNNYVIDLKVEENSYDRPKISSANLYSAKTPKINKIQEYESAINLIFEGASRYNIYQDNNLIKSSLSMQSFKMSKPEYATCFVVEADSVNKSFHSEPMCYWPKGSISNINIDSRSSFISKDFSIEANGTYLIQTVFENSGDLSTGITSSVKEISVYKSGAKVHFGYIFMPHSSQITDSNFIKVKLEKSAEYKIEIKDSFNMSYFDHFRTYIHRGGRSGSDNSAYIYSIKILRR